MFNRSRTFAILGMIGWCLVTSTIGFAQSPDPEKQPTDQWTHHLDHPGVRSVAFDPDGRSVYIHVHEPMINIWTLLVSHWPELLTGVLALETVVLIYLLLRIRRRPQVRNQPYCRKCNYNLSSHVDCVGGDKPARFEVFENARCPECGLELNRRRLVRGRTRRRRLAIIAPLWGITGLALAIMLLAGVPREGRVGRYFNWPSTTLVEIARNRNVVYLDPWIRKMDLVYEVDLANGRIMRVLLKRQLASYPKIVLSRNGQGLYMNGPKRNQVSRYRTSDGRLESSVTLPGSAGGFLNEPAVIGISDDDSIVYVQWFDRKQALCGVEAWDWRADRSETLLSTSAWVDPTPGPNFAWSRVFLVDTRVEPPSFYSRPQFMEAYNSQQYIVRNHGAGDDCIEFLLPVNPDPSSDAYLTADGRFIIVVARHGSNFLMIDVRNGETTEFNLPRLRFGQLGIGKFTLSEDGTLLAGGFSKYIHVIDYHARKLIHSFPLPPGLIAPKCQISPDNRWLAAVCQKSQKNAQGGWDHELVLWDMQSFMNPGEPSRTPAGE
ncbi:MAG: hypothetical protein IID30_15055 [Planctomycetes bacterium]|nr:hypothetical protein [Planctomycetota bacterium]